MSLKYLYLIGTVFFTVYMQIVLKWRILAIEAAPDSLKDKITLLGKLILDPYIISVYIAAAIASVLWMATIAKLQLSFAYPIFISLSILLVLTFSVIFFEEQLSTMKLLGTVLILAGLFVFNLP